MLAPARLELSGERLRVVYRLDGLDDADAAALARHICVEQTVEFPADLIPADDDISAHIIGQIDDVAPTDGGHMVAISYAAECTAYQLPQLMNVVFGNISLLPGIRVESLDLPPSLLAAFPGPRFGVDGLRRLLDAHGRPILATALKPMGTPLEVLAEMTYDFAAAGIDLIKDDHGLSSQPFANFERRVELCTAAVARANADHGTRAVYLPSLNVGADRAFAAAAMVRDAGAQGVLLLPGLYGYDTMRAVAADDDLGLVVMSHPSMLGAFTSPAHHGIGHALVLGTLARLAGADVSVFPNHSGRFSFAPGVCASIAGALTEPLGHLAPAFPAPAGGMTLQRIPEMIEFYGDDVVLLIGGELHRGDRCEQARAMRSAAERGLR
jgi:ribulose-bisphosphate carboxylase large chain